MALLAGYRLLIVAATFLGTPLAIAGAEGVLRFSARLADQGRVDDEDELPLAALHGEQYISQGIIEALLLPTHSSQEAADLPTMQRVGGHAPGGPRARHPPPMDDESQHHFEHHCLR